MDKEDITRSLWSGLFTPPAIQAKADEVLRTLAGMSFADAAQALDIASEMLSKAQSRLLRAQTFNPSPPPEVSPSPDPDWRLR